MVVVFLPTLEVLYSPSFFTPLDLDRLGLSGIKPLFFRGPSQVFYRESVTKLKKKNLKLKGLDSNFPQVTIR